MGSLQRRMFLIASGIALFSAPSALAENHPTSSSEAVSNSVGGSGEPGTASKDSTGARAMAPRNKESQTRDDEAVSGEAGGSSELNRSPRSSTGANKTTGTNAHLRRDAVRTPSAVNAAEGGSSELGVNPPGAHAETR